jgi:chaperonin cofactor prefoldin
VTDEEAQKLRRENDYLKLRCAQLEGDIGDLNAELTRLRQTLDHTMARRAASRPDPLSGGQ